MENSLLNNYLLDLLDSLEQNLCGFTADQNPESLHRLRLDIKKIKAVFSFAEYIYKEKYDVTKVKQLFNEAGKIREMQINIQQLSQVPNPPKTLVNQLNKEEKKLAQQFIKGASQYIRLIQDFKTKIRFPEKALSKKRTIKYFKKKKKKTNKSLQNIDKGGLHEYRKKIKKLIYVYNALPKKLQNKIDLNEAAIHKQQKKLGEWHDTYSAIEFLSNKHLPKNTSEYISTLKEKENRQFKDLRKNLKNKQK